MEQSNCVLVADAEIFFDLDYPVLGTENVNRVDIEHAESVLGVKLPGAYLELIQQRNGGYLLNNKFLGIEGYSDVPYLTILLIRGIGGEDGVDSIYDNRILNQALITSWGYPTRCVVLAHFFHGGVVLDYTEVGPTGEPTVVYVDADMYPDVKTYKLAPDFSSFLRNLRWKI